ncbi:hypothetical protein DUNSADRAFT_1319 [Dunaliella salina]|uniref:Encoded protein n=1 Tax=Dunaliella salina TaxID=3046 RepID=A0ABQ7FXM1_DUNSA|nr:hypothetical protein DUNSADRAFT_1319 [Dunaliella salina]|eukprot:KAF5827105.1 hypothetical protein DUNSADRAFT_1319 [Dunaliella salina]
MALVHSGQPFSTHTTGVSTLAWHLCFSHTLSIFASGCKEAVQVVAGSRLLCWKESKGCWIACLVLQAT